MSSKDIAATTPNKRLHEDKAVNWSKPENVEKLRHYWDLTHGSIEDTARVCLYQPRLRGSLLNFGSPGHANDYGGVKSATMACR